MAKKVTSIKVDPELWKRTRMHCLKKGVSVSDLVEKLLEEELKKSK